MADEIIEKLLTELNQKAKEIAKIYGTLKTLKEYGASFTLPDMETLIGSGEQDNGGINETVIRPDEFYGLSQTEATEKYLRMKGHAMAFEDIFNALALGGIRFSSNGRVGLNIQLTRATKKFAKIGKGTNISFGLVEWYPTIRRRRVVGTSTLNVEDENIDEGIVEEKIKEDKEKGE
jgi:hypothetical protein